MGALAKSIEMEKGTTYMYEKLHFDVGYFEGGHTIKENIPEFLQYYIFDTV